MRISIIVAVARNGVIGAGNRLPWRLSGDLKHFKAVTMGKPVIMGRKTHESIGKPLPGRTNIVLTRRRGYVAEGCTVVHNAEEALGAAGGAEECMVIGGAAVYRMFLPLAGRLYLTRVEAEAEGEVRFPEYRPEAWKEISKEGFPADDKNEYPYTFIVYERLDPGMKRHG
jgi:dihydrofolate reductase